MKKKVTDFEDPRCMTCDTPLEEIEREEFDDEYFSITFKCPHCGTIETYYPCQDEDEDDYPYFQEGGEDDPNNISHGMDGFCPRCGSHIIWGSDFMRSEVFGDVDEEEKDEYGCLKDDSLARSLYCPHCGGSIDLAEAKPSEYKNYKFFDKETEE